MRFCLISEKTVPEESVDLLTEACRARNIPIEVIAAKTFNFDFARKLQAGDLLYNSAVSIAAARAEQFLYSAGVATFHVRPDGVFFHVSTQPLLAEAAGIPIPATTYVASSDSGILRGHVDRLGGFPLVLKVMGRSSGIGIMLAESMASLKSQVDFLLAQGLNPLLCRFIANATHWRIVVLNGERIASYRNKPVDDDFRTCGSTDRADFDTLPPAAAVDVAVRATVACSLEFAGVDVLEDPAGNVWFLEANFPCYYPHAQIYGGMDIAGPMVDFLVDKASRLSKENASSHQRPVVAEYVRLRQAVSPEIFTIENFADSWDCDYILNIADRLDTLKERGIELHRGPAGFSFEIPIRGDAVLERIRNEIHRATGMENDFGFTFRFRRYAPQESHPPHLDEYQLAGRSLVATAMLYLTDTEEGAETSFPDALPAPVRISPQRGKLVSWLNCSPAAVHESLPVKSGVKATITYFFYQKS